MSNVPPTNVAYEQVAAALATLSIDLKDLREVVIERQKITTRYFRRTADGQLVAADEMLAEVTYETGIIR